MMHALHSRLALQNIGEILPLITASTAELQIMQKLITAPVSHLLLYAGMETSFSQDISAVPAQAQLMRMQPIHPVLLSLLAIMDIGEILPIIPAKPVAQIMPWLITAIVLP